jgi:hypothetical protein
MPSSARGHVMTQHTTSPPAVSPPPAGAEPAAAQRAVSQKRPSSWGRVPLHVAAVLAICLLAVAPFFER